MVPELVAYQDEDYARRYAEVVRRVHIELVAEIAQDEGQLVLRRAIEAGLPERSIIMALGPGFTLSTAMLGRPYS